MADKRFIYKRITSRSKSLSSIQEDFENELNNIPLGYDFHSWQVNPGTNDTSASYHVVFEKKEEVHSLPFGRKFKKGE